MASPPARAELISAVNAALRDVSRDAVSFSHGMAARLGLGPSALACLKQLAGGPQSIAALAQATGLTSGAAAGVIERLERAGLVSREPDPADRRKLLARATTAATGRAGSFHTPMERALTSSLAVYTDDELAFLLEFLIRTRDAAHEALLALRETPTPAERRHSVTLRHG
ncbi:MAG TPA: MarR family transcriptional regulator [Caulobacteraceae bacterium]|jgi:DNA-binding MarR family transcriptional regulator